MKEVPVMENALVRKSNYLIEASYKLSLAEQRLIIILASMIKPSDVEFKKYPLSVKAFSTILELKHRDEYSQLKEVTKRLLTRAFSLKLPGAILQVSWLSSAKYVEGKGIVELCFDPELKQFLLQLKERYTSYKLKNIIQLKSSFSIRIYELLKQYEKVGERTFHIDKLREQLGIDESQYKLYGDFKRKVLLMAQRELAEKTDISFDFEEIKVGRGVGKIRFILKMKNMPAKDALIPIQEPLPGLISASPELEKLEQLLPERFRGKVSIRKILAQYLGKRGYDYVSRNVIYTNEKSNASTPGAASGKPANYRNYLAKALQEDFGLAFHEDQEARRAAEEVRRQAEKAAAHERKLHDDKLRIERENHERARVYQESLTPESLAALREEAIARLDPQQQELLRRKGHGSELLLKVSMTRICLERMKLSQPA